MNNIDIIYYQATTTDAIGSQSYIQAQYFIPFFDYFLAYSVFMFTVALSAFVYHVFNRK